MNQIVLPGAMTLIANSALSRLRSYLDDHGDSLDAIFRQVRADPEASISTRLRSLSGESATEQERHDLVRSLRKLQDDLVASIGEPVVEVAGAHMGADFDAGLRWHAARLTDITPILNLAYGA